MSGEGILLTVYSTFDWMQDAVTQAGDAEKIMTGTGGYVFHLLSKISIFGIVIALLLCGISFLIKGSDARERAGLKAWLMRIGIVLLLVTSLTSLAGLFANFMQSVF